MLKGPSLIRWEEDLPMDPLLHGLLVEPKDKPNTPFPVPPGSIQLRMDFHLMFEKRIGK